MSRTNLLARQLLLCKGHGSSVLTVCPVKKCWLIRRKKGEKKSRNKNLGATLSSPVGGTFAERLFANEGIISYKQRIHVRRPLFFYNNSQPWLCNSSFSPSTLQTFVVSPLPPSTPRRAIVCVQRTMSQAVSRCVSFGPFTSSASRISRVSTASSPLGCKSWRRRATTKAMQVWLCLKGPNASRTPTYDCTCFSRKRRRRRGWQTWKRRPSCCGWTSEKRGAFASERASEPSIRCLSWRETTTKTRIGPNILSFTAMYRKHFYCCKWYFEYNFSVPTFIWFRIGDLRQPPEAF